MGRKTIIYFINFMYLKLHPNELKILYAIYYCLAMMENCRPDMLKLKRLSSLVKLF